MSEKKIMYVISHVDSFWSHRYQLACGARDRGYAVIVAAAGAKADRKLEKENFKGVDLPDSGGMPGTARTIMAIRSLMIRENPDIVHAVTIKYVFMTGLAACFRRNVKIVLTVAGLGYLFSDEGLKPKLMRLIAAPFMKLALKGPRTKVIFQNPDDQELMAARRFVESAHCVLIRGSGVDINQFPFTEEPKNEIPLIVLPSRLLRDKGIVEFIEAARILRGRGRKVDCRIAGGYAGYNPLAISPEEMQSMTADGAATWLGKITDMPGLLAGCNLVVYPSYREGLPKALLEAASIGRAIITTDRPGCREAVTHGLNGLLVPVRNSVAIADAVEKLLDDEPLRRRMGKEGRARAENEFNVDLVVKKTLAVYEDGTSSEKLNV